MKKRVKPLETVCGSSGASLVFVLAVMLFLFALGTSVFVAAGASIKTGLDKQNSDQLALYADSIQKSVMYGLQTSESDESASISSARTLGGQLLRAVYGHYAAAYPGEPGDFPEIIIDETKLEGVVLDNVTIAIEIKPSVYISPAIPAQMRITDEDGNVIVPERERVPRTASVSASAVVTVTAEHEGKAVVSVVTYLLNGALLKDGGDESNMLIDRAGTWRFISHEKADL